MSKKCYSIENKFLCVAQVFESLFEDDERSGKPSTLKSEENVDKI